MRNKVHHKAVLLAVALPLVLTACTAGPSTVEELPAEPSPVVATASGSASPIPSAAGSSDDPLDNGGYAEYTWDDYVAGARTMSGLKSWPDVERIRFVSQEETPEVQASCLTGLGFPTTVGTDDSYQTISTPEQQEALAEASYTCTLQYPTDLRYAQAFNRTQLKTIHAYYRDELIPCLQERGLEIAPLPSEQTYVEGVVSGTASWDPYNSLDLASVDVAAMNQACPSMPAPEVLYGG